MVAASPSKGHVPPLPKGFVNFQDILDGKIRPKQLVNVMGILTKYRLPIRSGGPDLKSNYQLCDISTEESGDELSFHVFRKNEDQFPRVGHGEIILLRQARVQSYNQAYSLISNFLTEIHVCRPIPGSDKLEWHLDNYRVSADAAFGSRIPTVTTQEQEYAAWLFQNINRDRLPTIEEFDAVKIQSTHIVDKFSLLKDIKDGNFYDIIVQIVKEPHDLDDKVSIWVTDYTENPAFFNHAYAGGPAGSGTNGGQAGDPYGYTSKYSVAKAKTDWPGPFGKRSLQMTCWEPHATSMRQSIKGGAWLRFRNVQIKYGSNGSNLEGFLREDRGTFTGKLNVEVLDTVLAPGEDADSIEPRLKEAIRRKRDYEKNKKSQLKELKSGCGGKKGKTGLHPEAFNKLTSKQRRALQRAQGTMGKPKEEATKPEAGEALLGLNAQVVCENPDEPITSVSRIRAPVYWTTTVDGEERKIEMPFSCARFRTYARVVDFYPPKLEDFSYGRRQTEFDMLSDNSGSDSEGSDDGLSLGSPTQEVVWQWRFALRLEDPTANGQEKPSLWAMVGNTEAQLLTGLDACNLRKEPATLDTLRERLFVLWGELEERKLAEEEEARPPKRRKNADGPPPDSSDGEDAQERTKAVANRPFVCCIEQYGDKVAETEPQRANAGEGLRYQRVFSMFGTKISYI